MNQIVRFRLNGRPVSVSTDGERELLWVLRTDLELTGTKYGCGQNQCGACTVLVNGEAVRSCQYPVKNIAGKEVITIEGLEQEGKPHPLQRAFAEQGAVQCGFCSPGMIMSAYGLLMKNTRPTRAQITESMDGNLCRCGSYSRIISAIQAAAAEMRGKEAR